MVLIEKLLAYSKTHLHLDFKDEIYFRNILLSKFKTLIPSEEKIDIEEIKNYQVPDLLIKEICDYIMKEGIKNEKDQEIFCADVLGILTPIPSVVNETFRRIKVSEGAQSACDYLYDLCVKNGYIQKTAIERNLKWEYRDGENRLEITVNLSKPEKNNKEIAKLLTTAQDKKYPSCALCKENEGFEGTAAHPPRRNLRTLKMKLGGEPWFMQYSPYAYYDEHCIVINENHTPMKVDETTPNKLLDFVDELPNYFIGSNASLPIVGGSILNHEHFQGGKHLMPMHHANYRKEYVSEQYTGLKIGILDWYNSALQCEGEDRKEIAAFAAEVIDKWKKFDCPECEILSHTGNTPHNALSPICRKVGDKYIFTMILRNNRTDERYPDGIFHVHPEYLNIKSEGIGLIEAMGLFILPPRLKRQLNAIEDILCGITEYNRKALEMPDHDLYVHRSMIEKLVSEGFAKDKTQAHNLVQKYVNRVCAGILDNTAVFKKDTVGQAGFEKFMKVLNLREK